MSAGHEWWANAPNVTEKDNEKARSFSGWRAATWVLVRQKVDGHHHDTEVQERVECGSRRAPEGRLLGEKLAIAEAGTQRTAINSRAWPNDS